ncbi:ATP-binding cassette domain-containing protein [bacterium]|jgi:phospholipid/cholesterol/gamma-HCH transport system ATP-binding protein|nr:ATP-binding cassette domain-containing protein [bacterium]
MIFDPNSIDDIIAANASTTPIDGDAPPLLHIDDVSVTFGRPVLRNIRVHIPKGQTIAVIGESGCGKTVLLKTIVNLIEPTGGRVLFDGRNLAKLSERELTRQRLRFGFVFQGAALFDSLSVYDNVAFALRGHFRMDETQIRQVVRDRLLEVGLSTDIIRLKPAELSGGMRKRVGLARAVAGNPEVMLYDEPTTGLDPIMSDVVNELIIGTRRLHKVTSVVVTHDMKSAVKVADRIVMLYPIHRLSPGESQILFDGPPAEILSSPDPRVTQFVRGEARDRLMELSQGDRSLNEY